jgi:FkbM family methyltransferase
MQIRWQLVGRMSNPTAFEDEWISWVDAQIRAPVGRMLFDKYLGLPRESEFVLPGGIAVVKLIVPFLPHPVYLRHELGDLLILREAFSDRVHHNEFLMRREVRVVVDAGASIGLAAILFANLFPAAHIVCLEPHPVNFELLRMNTAPYPNIIPVWAGVWNSHAPLRILNADGPTYGYRTAVAVEGSDGSIPGMSVPELIESIGEDRISLLKVDIEGAESEVFSEGTTSWLSKVDAIMIELHEHLSPGCSQSFYRALVPYSFRTYLTFSVQTVLFDHSEIPRATEQQR